MKDRYILGVLIGLAILFTVYIVLVNYWGTLGHEQAHVQTNKYFGAPSTPTTWIDLSGIHGHTTVDENAQFYSEDDRRAAYLAHAINENIGYQLIPYFNGLMILFMIIIIIFVSDKLCGDDYNGKGSYRQYTIHGEGSNSERVEQSCTP